MVKSSNREIVKLSNSEVLQSFRLPRDAETSIRIGWNSKRAFATLSESDGLKKSLRRLYPNRMDSKKVFDTSIRIGWRQKMSLTTLSESDGLIQAKSSRNKKGHDREDEILNYFVNRSTNTATESLNAKIKDFRAQLRGVIDKKFISCSFSRHAKTHASMVLVIWLNENVLHLQTG